MHALSELERLCTWRAVGPAAGQCVAAQEGKEVDGGEEKEGGVGEEEDSSGIEGEEGVGEQESKHGDSGRKTQHERNQQASARFCFVNRERVQEGASSYMACACRC